MSITRGLAPLLCAVVLISGCGTIVGLSGPHEVKVHTNPPGAEVFVDGIATGLRSPATVLVDPGEEHRVDARLDDLHGGSHIKRSASVGVIICDVLFTLGIGISIDWSTGGLYYFPDSVVVNLGRPYGPEPPLAAQYPRPPALMPYSDPIAPARPVAPKKAAVETRHTNLLHAAPCDVCGSSVAQGATCGSCGQPPRDGR